MIPRMPLDRALGTVSPAAANEVLFHFGYGGHRAGSFFTALLAAWDHADMVNSNKLAQAFPEHGAALALLGDDHSGIATLRHVAEGGQN